jgi:hypothetical protein
MPFFGGSGNASHTLATLRCPHHVCDYFTAQLSSSGGPTLCANTMAQRTRSVACFPRRPQCAFGSFEIRRATGDPRRHVARSGTRPLPHPQTCTRLLNSEQNTQDAMLQVAWSLSPKVEAPQPGLCTADLRGCRKEPERAVFQALHRLEALHLSARAGLAPLANLALLAAHQAKPLLCIKDVASFTAALPLPTLTQDTHLLRTLSKWGIHTADELLKLPRQQALERLGPSGHPLWTAAQGVDNRPLCWAKEPAVYEETLAFEQEIETLEPLLFVLNRFLEELLRRMKGNAHLTSGLQLELTLENHSTYARKFAVPAPTLDAGVLLGILKVHLEQLHLEHRPVRVTLRLEPSQEKAYHGPV